MHNNPLTNTDPSGHDPREIDLMLQMARDGDISRSEASSQLGGYYQGIFQDDDNNYFNYLFAKATMTSPYGNSLEESKWAIGVLVNVNVADIASAADLANLLESYVEIGAAVATGAKSARAKASVNVSAECNCFTAGTNVLTDEGEKPIEEIELGDKVLAKSDETGEVAYKEVVGLFQKQADEIYYVHIGNEIIEVTGLHPFWLEGEGWTLVKDLKVGDFLVSSNGTKMAIGKIEKETRQATVYNFEVADFHSYFVSNLGIWVHNCASPNLPSARWINHDVYNELTKLQLDKKFVKAKDMGYARAREGADGIISLTDNEILTYKGNTYNYKLKVTGAPNHVRVYGRVDENGAMIFDYMTSGK